MKASKYYVIEGNVEGLKKLLLERETDPNPGADPKNVQQSLDMHFLSMVAANNLEAVKSDVAQGANIQAVNTKGGNALHIAVEAKVRPGLVRYLLKLKVDHKIKDKEGHTPLNIANIDMEASMENSFPKSSVVNHMWNLAKTGMYNSLGETKSGIVNLMFNPSLEYSNCLDVVAILESAQEVAPLGDSIDANFLAHTS